MASNATEPTLLAQALGRIAYEFTLVQPLLPTYAHLLISALFPIYCGAHASLSRPSSAAKPSKPIKTSASKHGTSDEEDEEEEQRMEGLSPSDALMMPVMAGLTLTGLYFLIKWLKDTVLLNKILNWYFALFAVFSVGRLITDALDMGHSIIFPRRYAWGGSLWHVQGKEAMAVPAGAGGKEEAVNSPLPGVLSRIPLSEKVKQILWADRAMPGNKWTVRVYLHRLIAARMKIGPHGIAGFLLALAAVSFFNFVSKPWYLTNLMGFGFSYGALQIMSPTTFGTGSLILGALFFYDIYFVFFTPMMVTVAKSLDVPIKLVFPRPAPPGASSALPSLAMLGLGDVVLPGIMIGLALRFDLYLFYLRQQKHIPASPTDEAQPRTVIVKPKYFSLAGRWSDHFWTHSWTGRPLFAASSHPEPPFTFPKTYFNASLVGYIVGMLTTLGVMQVWGHAQPALLYLVPGVVGALWSTALFRGQMRTMWEFSEAVEEEEEAGKEKKPRSSIFSKESRERQADKLERSLKKHVTGDDEHTSGGGDDSLGSEKQEASRNEQQEPRRSKDIVEHRTDREVFSISIEAPWELTKPHSVAKGSSNTQHSKTNPEASVAEKENEKPSSRLVERQNTMDEPVSKRLRTK